MDMRDDQKKVSVYRLIGRADFIVDQIKIKMQSEDGDKEKQILNLLEELETINNKIFDLT